LVFSLPASTNIHRKTESAVAQPTHEPVDSWLLIFHHDWRRSFEAGMAAGAASTPASVALSKLQSFSVFLEGRTLRILRELPFIAESSTGAFFVRRLERFFDTVIFFLGIVGPSLTHSGCGNF
jgi:hypothetical protein